MRLVGSDAVRARWQPVAIGLAGGLAAGLLGVGGGIVIVPLLVANLKIAQRRAHAISLAAIIPAALVGTAVYGEAGELSWSAAGWLALGALVGAPLGVRALARRSDRELGIVFLLFSIVAGVRLLIA